MFIRTDDPIDDFLQYDAEQQRLAERIPKCAVCNHTISQTMAVRINGEFYCDDCLIDLRERVDG